jgi:hypothetical protein
MPETASAKTAEHTAVARTAAHFKACDPTHRNRWIGSAVVNKKFRNGESVERVIEGFIAATT